MQKNSKNSKKLKKRPSICVITMTYNRPEYVKKSIDSLYSKAGLKFDHYVFDDCSNSETHNVLQSLKKQYNFKLIRNKKRFGLYLNFHTNITKIKKIYDYYLKHDSDIELLSDNVLAEMLEVVDFPENISGITVRLEGMRNVDRYDARINFYNGHAIKYDTPIIYGCFMLLPHIVFRTFDRLTASEIKESTEQWGIDSEIYAHALKHGKFIVVEDLSIYHIDNSYGQRKKDAKYFSDRNRWSNIDHDEIMLMSVSSELKGNFISRHTFDEIYKMSSTYKEFKKLCKDFLKNEKLITHKNNETITVKYHEDRMIQKHVEKDEVKYVYRVTAPANFKDNQYMARGESRIYNVLPDWAKNNPCFVVEKIKVDK